MQTDRSRQHRVKSLSTHRRNMTTQNINLMNTSVANTHFELLQVPKVVSKQAALFMKTDHRMRSSINTRASNYNSANTNTVQSTRGI